jgi:hypothetical protein
MKKNIQQNHNHGKTFEIQETDLLQTPPGLLFLGPLIIGIIGFVLIFLCTANNGVGLSGDSVGYITWARNLYENHSFSKQDGSFLLGWPPLYPIFLACFKLCGINDFLAARLISTLSFGLIIFLSGLWTLKYSRSLTFSLMVSICALLSKPLAFVCSWAWSEPLFILFIVVFLILVPEVINKPTLKSTLLLAVITSAICLTRYIGVMFLPFGAILLFSGIKHLRKKLIFTSIWGFASAILPGIWLLRNQILSGTLTGNRSPASTTLIKNIELAGNFIGSWFLPINSEKTAHGRLFFILFCTFFSAIFAVNAYKIIKAKKADWPIMSVSLFLVLYITAIIYAATKKGMDLIDDRFLAPAYPAIIIIVWDFISNLFSSDINSSYKKTFSLRRAVLYGLIVAIGSAIWIIAGIYSTVASARQVSEKGYGFSNVKWKASETIAWLKSNRLNTRIYTNDPYAIYILAGLNADFVPTNLDYFKTSDPCRLDVGKKYMSDFISSLKSPTPPCLVWFLNHFRTYLYNPNELQEFCSMKIIKKLPDGYIVALYPKEPSVAPPHK